MEAYAGEEVEQRKKNTLLLLMGVQTCTATMEINMAIPQKIESLSTSRPIYTTLGHIPKGRSILPQEHVLIYACYGFNS